MNGVRHLAYLGQILEGFAVNLPLSGLGQSQIRQAVNDSTLAFICCMVFISALTQP